MTAAEMELMDWIRPMALVVSFFLLVAFDRRVWMTGEAIIMTGFGVGLLVLPANMLDYEVDGDFDDLHLRLARLCGVALICSNILTYLARETRDGTVPISIMTARVFESGVQVLSFLYSYYYARKSEKAAKWNEQLLYFGLVGVVLRLLGNLYHLILSDDFSTYPQSNVRINMHLRIDAFCTLLAALAFLAFPNAAIWSLLDSGKLDQVHVHLSRDLGIQLLVSSLVSLQAGGYLHEHDKRHHFTARIVTSVCMCAMFGIMELQGGVFNRDKWLKISLVFGAPVINAVLGYFADGTMFYRPSFKQD